MVRKGEGEVMLLVLVWTEGRLDGMDVLYIIADRVMDGGQARERRGGRTYFPHPKLFGLFLFFSLWATLISDGRLPYIS